MVIPSSVADEALLTQLLQTVQVILQRDARPPPAALTWLSDLFHHPQGALLNLISRPDVMQENLPEGTATCQRFA